MLIRHAAFLRAVLAASLVALPILLTPPALEAQRAPRAGRAPAIRFDTVRAFIRRTMEESAVPSIAVAVARNGQIIWEEGFGLADRERIEATRAERQPTD